jgi:hypothetical protein
MTLEDQISMYDEAKLEDRMLTCLEIQARLVTILDVLEIGQIAKAEVAGQGGPVPPTGRKISTDLST